MALENVTMIAGGTGYEGWQKVTVQQGLNQGTMAFQIEVTEIPDDDQMVDPEVFFQKWHFPPNTLVQLFATGTLLLDGVIDEYRPSAARQLHKVTVAGRGKSRDYIDSSAKSTTSQFEDMPVEDIARALDHYGVGIRVEVPTGPPINFFRLRQGATAYAEIMRILPMRGLTLKGNKEGDMSITNAKAAQRHSGGLFQGKNILAMQGQIRSNELFPLVEGKGQTEGDDETDKDLEAFAESTTTFFSTGGAGVSSVRNKTVVAPSPVTKDELQTLVDNEKNRAIGEACSAVITVYGWRDEGGTLWEPGWLVFTYAPILKLQCDMLIKSVSFEQDDQAGTVSILTLVNAIAFGLETGGASWDGTTTGSEEDGTTNGTTDGNGAAPE